MDSAIIAILYMAHLTKILSVIIFGGVLSVLYLPVLLVSGEVCGYVPVVCGGDGPEPLLPRRIPDLQLDLLPVQLYGPDLEIYP